MLVSLCSRASADPHSDASRYKQSGGSGASSSGGGGGKHGSRLVTDGEGGDGESLAAAAPMASPLRSPRPTLRLPAVPANTAGAPSTDTERRLARLDLLSDSDLQSLGHLVRGMPGGCSVAFQSRFVLHVMHAAVASTFTAQTMAQQVLPQMIRAYREVLKQQPHSTPSAAAKQQPQTGNQTVAATAASSGLSTSPTALPPATGQELHALQDVLLQLFKYLLPYARSPRALHELLKLVEGPPMDGADSLPTAQQQPAPSPLSFSPSSSTSSRLMGSPQLPSSSPAAAGSSSSPPAPSPSLPSAATTPAASSSSSVAQRWPFAVCGMLIDACASSPSLPYLLFDGDSPATLSVAQISDSVWPPGLGAAALALAPTGASASAAAAAAAQRNSTIGYSFAIWVYMEPIEESLLGGSANLGAHASAASASSPSSRASPRDSAAAAASHAASQFYLLHISGDDGRLSVELTYHADTGTLLLRIGGSGSSGAAAQPVSHEFQHVGLIPHRWCHLALCHNRGSVGSTAAGAARDVPIAELFVDGVSMSATRMSYLPRPLVTANSGGAVMSGAPAAGSTTVGGGGSACFNAWMGSSSLTRSGHVHWTAPTPGLRWRWRVASLVLMDLVLSPQAVKQLYDAGPRVAGSVPSTLCVAPVFPGEGGSGASGVTPGASNDRFPTTDVTAGCYALPSACAEAQDELAASVTRARKLTGTFAGIGTASSVGGGIGSPSFGSSNPSSNNAGTAASTAAWSLSEVLRSPTSPTSPHEQWLAPAASSEQELLTQTEISPLEADSLGLNSLVAQERLLFAFHARHARPVELDAQALREEAELASLHLVGIVPSVPRPHTTLPNTGCTVGSGSAGGCSDAVLFGVKCAAVQPTPAPDVIRTIGGMKRILLLVEQCCQMGASKPSSSSAAGAGGQSFSSSSSSSSTSSLQYTEHFNPSTCLRQALLLLVMCLRRNPKNCRDMHAINGYRMLALLLKQVAGRKFRIRLPMQPQQAQQLPPLPPPAVNSSGQGLASTSSSASSATAYSTGSTMHTLPVIDLPIVDLIFSLVGLSDRGMGGYIANLVALEALVLDYRLWERCGLETQLHVFQGLINCCVGNADRAANITALREARFVPWLLVILTNTKTFEQGFAGTAAVAGVTPLPSTGQVSRRSSAAAASPATSVSLLNHIMTLLRVLLMSELIDQELHLLANFAMTRTVGLVAAAAASASASAAAAASGASSKGGAHSRASSFSASPVPGPTPIVHHPSSSPVPTESGGGLASSSSASPPPLIRWGSLGAATASPALSPAALATLLAARRIQTAFVEMLLDVLLKIHTPSNRTSGAVAGPNRALAIFTKSINFSWVFAVLKSDLPAMSVAASTLADGALEASSHMSGVRGTPRGAATGQFATSSSSPALGSPPPASRSSLTMVSAAQLLELRDPECALLSLKMLLVLLDSPQMLAEFRSSSMQAATSPPKAAAPAGLDGSELATAASRVVSFASLSNLLLPYATCPRIYPVLLCIMLGRGVHDLTTMPAELGVETVETLFNAMLLSPASSSSTRSAAAAPPLLNLVVPEVVDILVDLMSKCLHLLSAAQQERFEADPVGFFSASAAVASFVPPLTPRMRVYRDIYETGVLQGPVPASIRAPASQGKAAQAHHAAQIAARVPFALGPPANPNKEKENTLAEFVGILRGPIVADLVASITAESLAVPTPTAAGSSADQSHQHAAAASSSMMSLQGTHGPTSLHAPRPNPLATSTPMPPLSAGHPTHAHVSFSFPSARGSKSSAALSSALAASSVPALPSMSLLNGLVLFFMRMLHANEDFGRVVSRSTFLRPFVAAVFTSAHLNPIVSMGLPMPTQQQQNHAAPMRPASAQGMRGGGARFNGIPMVPASTRSASGAMSAAPLQGRSFSSVEPTASGSGGGKLHVAPSTPGGLLSPSAGGAGGSEISGLLSPESGAIFSPSSMLSPESASSQATPFPPHASPASSLHSVSEGDDHSDSHVSGGADRLSMMDLRSPPSSGASISPDAHSFGGSPPALITPQHLAFHQQQLASLVAPVSPQGSPAASPGFLGSGDEAAFSLNIDASMASSPQSQSLYTSLSGGAFVLPPGLTPYSTRHTTSSVFEAAFSSTPLPESVSASQLPAYYTDPAMSPSGSISAGFSPSPASSTSAAHGFSSSSVPSTAHLRIPLFRHATSQLLLRFLRQIMLYNLLHKKDGWMILEKVLDSFPSHLAHGNFKSISAGIAQGASGSEHEPLLPDHATATVGGEDRARNEELIRGFQSAIMSILIIRLQEKLAQYSHASGSGSALASAAAQSLFVASNSVGVGLVPSKFLVNVSRAVEMLFSKIQCGLFHSQNWTAANLARSGATEQNDATLTSVGQTLSSVAVSKGTGGSTVGLLLLLVGMLQHEGLRAHVAALNSSAASLYAGKHSRRKGSSLGGPALSGSGSFSARDSGSTLGTLSAQSAVSSAALTAAPLNKALRSLMDILMTSVLHLYDLFTTAEISVTDLTALNQFILANRTVLLGDYMVGAHISTFLAPSNALNAHPSAVPAAATAAASGPHNLIFTGRSFVACLFYNLYYFQLQHVEEQPTHPPPATATAAPPEGRPEFLPFLPPMSPPTGTVGAQSSLASSAASTELRHSALAILVWLVRTKAAMMCELMKASVASSSLQAASDEFAAAPANRRTVVSTPDSSFISGSGPACSYDVFNKGFDVLGHGFNLAVLREGGAGGVGSSSSFSSSSQSSPMSSPMSQAARAEIDGFFSWLEIQSPIISAVLSRTLLPEFKAYAGFLNQYLVSTHLALLGKWKKFAAKDKENEDIDLAELAHLHTTLRAVLDEASAVDQQRYMRRLQGLLESEKELAKSWNKNVRTAMRRMLCMYSKSRAIHVHVPRRNEFKIKAREARRRRREEAQAQRIREGLTAATTEEPPESSDDAISSSSSDGESLLAPGSFKLVQKWKLDSMEGPSRTRPRLVRESMLAPDAPKFSYPYKKEQEEVAEAKRNQDLFVERRKQQSTERDRAEAARAASASVPLTERASPDGVVMVSAGGDSAMPGAGAMERSLTEAVGGAPGVTAGFENSGPVTIDSTSPGSSFRAVDPLSLSREDTGGESRDTVSLSVELNLFSPRTLGTSVSAVTTPSGASSGTGKDVPESSDRPTPMRRAATCTPMATPLSALATPSSGTSSSADPLAVAGLRGGKQRRKSFFGGQVVAPQDASAVSHHSHSLSTIGTHAASARNLLGSSPRELRSSPRNSPRLSGTQGAASPNATTTTTEPVPSLHLYPQPARRRGVSFDSDDPSESEGSAPPAAVPASSPSIDVISPTSGTSAPSSATPVDADGASAAKPSTDLTLALPSPPQLQVDSPGGQHVRAENANFQTSPAQAAGGVVVPADKTGAVATVINVDPVPATSGAPVESSSSSPPLSSHASSSLLAPPDSLDLGAMVPSSPSIHSNGSPNDGTHDGGDDDSIAHYSALLAEEFSWFLYEERLRLLLDTETITFHYNCLRIAGLEEVSAVLLLCTQTLFIVDQYQVHANGSIVRLELTPEEAAAKAKNQLLSDGDASEDDELGGGAPASAGGAEASSRRWSYADIVAVHKRRYLLRPAALEIFFADHTNYLLVVNIKQREQIYKNIMQLCPNLLTADGTLTAGGASGTLAPGGATLTAGALAASSGVAGGGAAANPNAAASTAGAGLAVGVGGLTALSATARAPDMPASLSVGTRLTSMVSSIFFTNHALATEHGIGMVDAALASVLATFTTEWQHGAISNMEYLLLLNSASGRSYNDLTQYPVFPWVLSEWDSAELDLHDPASFRDLNKPMGALDDTRARLHRQKYRETESIWRDEEREAAARSAAGASAGAGPFGSMLSHASIVSPDVCRAYNYGTHYSSAAVVMYYLLRVAPYTQYHIHFQSGRIDRSDRLWSSVKNTWITASKLASGDVKELIPEHFYLPAMLKNGNELELGRRQDGRPVNDVLLPPWAHRSARQFIRLHRLALESDWVSAHLHLWIDLIFGEKQMGDAAVKALNVFHYVTYAGAVDIDRITDPILRRGTIEQIRSFGQCPMQLFTKAHPPKLVAARQGRIFAAGAAAAMEATDMSHFGHSIAQIFCVDSTLMLAGSGAAAAALSGTDRNGNAGAERLFVLKHGQSIAVPALQPASSFLPYSLHGPAVCSSRNIRSSKSYRTSPAFNKLTLLSWNHPDGSLRNGVLDIGHSTASSGSGGGLERASSISMPTAAALSPAGGLSLKTHRSYINMHDGPVRVAAVPMEGDDGTLVTGGDDALVCVWRKGDLVASLARPSFNDGPHPEMEYALVGELAGHRGAITCLAVSKSFSLIASGSVDSSVILWDLTRLQAIRQLHFASFGASISAVCINAATGDIVFAANNPTMLCLTDVNGSLLAKYPDPRMHEALPDNVAPSAAPMFLTPPPSLLTDQRLDEITSLCIAGSVGFREPASDFTQSSASGVPTGLPYKSDCGALILTGHRSGFIRIWNLQLLTFAQLFTQITQRHAGRTHQGRSRSRGGSGSGRSRSHSPEIHVPGTAPTSPAKQASAPPVVAPSNDNLPALGPPIDLEARAATENSAATSTVVAPADADFPTRDEPSAETEAESTSPQSAATASVDAALVAAAAAASSTLISPTSTRFDLEVNVVNQGATGTSDSSSSDSGSSSSVPVLGVDTPGATPSHASIAAAQLTARAMTSAMFGSPGEEQMEDEYFRSATSVPPQQAPPQSVSSSALPPPRRQWHLTSIAELLGHQTPVTALTLHRDCSSFYSGDANGNLLHFTLPDSHPTHGHGAHAGAEGGGVAVAGSGYVCLCKPSRSKARVKLYQSLVCGPASAPLPLQRIACAHAPRCNFVGCDFCYLEHVRTRHPHPSSAANNEAEATGVAPTAAATASVSSSTGRSVDDARLRKQMW